MESSFLSEFIMITNLKTVIFMALLIGLFILISKLKRKFKFTQLMLISMATGQIGRASCRESVLRLV